MDLDSTALERGHRAGPEACASRWLAIVLPWWSTDLAERRRRANPPAQILVVREHHGAKQVVAACAGSQAVGVRPGMKLAHARALCGIESFELPWNPDADRRDLRRLASWCLRFSPRVMPVPGVLEALPGEPIDRRGMEPAIVIDITGCDLLHGGETSLAARVLRDLHRRRIHSQVAIASTQRAALAAASAWPCRVLPREGSGADDAMAALAPLPLWTLRLSPGLLDSLREINVTRVGQAMDLPRQGLIDRFGPELTRALDALRGERAEDFHAIPNAAPIECELCFDGATTRPGAIELAMAQLLERFCAKLARRQRGVRLLEVVLDRIDALPVVERLTLGRPSRRPEHLRTLLQPRLERVNLGYGVEAVRLRSLIDAPLRLEQRCWSIAEDGRTSIERGADHDQVGELVDQVRARLGHGAVRAQAFAMDARSAAHDRHGPEGVHAACRPTLLLPMALPADVVAAHERGDPASGASAVPRSRRPLEVRWAGGGGRVMDSDGPERHSPHWWTGRSGEVDCWRVRTEDGRWLWLLHRHPDRWSVIGLWA